jgi:small multidrug resistance pump
MRSIVDVTPSLGTAVAAGDGRITLEELETAGAAAVSLSVTPSSHAGVLQLDAPAALVGELGIDIAAYESTPLDNLAAVMAATATVPYLYLAIAILAEVIATSSLKATNGFTRWMPSLIVALGYGVAFYFLSLTLRTMSVGIAYAIWCGAGIVLVALISWLVLGQKLDAPAIGGMGLIIAGVVVINTFSKSVSH